MFEQLAEPGMPGAVTKLWRSWVLKRWDTALVRHRLQGWREGGGVSLSLSPLFYCCLCPSSIDDSINYSLLLHILSPLWSAFCRPLQQCKSAAATYIYHHQSSSIPDCHHGARTCSIHHLRLRALPPSGRVPHLPCASTATGIHPTIDSTPAPSQSDSL